MRLPALQVARTFGIGRNYPCRSYCKYITFSRQYTHPNHSDVTKSLDTKKLKANHNYGFPGAPLPLLFIVIFQSLVMAALASIRAKRVVIPFNFYFISHNFVYLCFKRGTCAIRPSIKFKTLWRFFILP